MGKARDEWKREIDECKDKDGMIITHSYECQKCDIFPCPKYICAMNAIINGED